MDVFDLYAKISLDSKNYETGLNKAKGSFDGFKTHLGDALKTVAKLTTAAVTAGAAATGKVIKDAVANYGEYEQLVGGIDSLFLESSQKVQDYARKAFSSAQISENEYMRLVTSFSGAIIKSSENREKAAELSNIAIQDMADQANKYGKTVQEVSQTYTSLARGNFQTLDNLFGGMFAGTKTGLKEMLTTAEKYRASLGKTVKYSETSYADIVSAIHDVSEMMGVSGTSAEEAGTTIQGSLASVKAAWQDTLTAMGSGKDLDKRLDNLTKSVKKYGENMKPILRQALKGAVSAIGELAPSVAAELPKLVVELAPDVIKAGADIAGSLVSGIYNEIANSKIDEGAKNLTEKINQVISNADAKGSGEKFALVVNKVIGAGFNTIETFDFKGAAGKLTTWFNSAVNNINWGKLGKTVGDAWKGVWDFIGTSIETIDWENVGEKISEFINAIDWGGILTSMFKVIGGIIKNMPELLKGVISNLDFDNAASAFALWYGPKMAKKLLNHFQTNTDTKSVLTNSGKEVGTHVGTGLTSKGEGMASGLVGKISSGLKTAGTIAEAFSIGYTIGTLIRSGLEAVAPGIMKPIDDAITWWLDNSEAGKWLLTLTGDYGKEEAANEKLAATAKKRQEIAKKYEAMGIETFGGTSSGLAYAAATRSEQLNNWTPNLVGGSTSSTSPRINSAADYKIYLDSGKLVGGTSKAYSSASANSYNYVTKGYSR